MQDGQLRVGIVGSRRRNTIKDMRIVYRLVEKLIRHNPDKKIVIVSGGCPKGADKFAEEAADIYKLDKDIYPVPEGEYAHKGEWVAAAFARNREIPLHSDVVYALCHEDRKGGTENTIEHCRDLEKETYLVDENGNCLLIVAGKQNEKVEADKAGDS